MRCPGHVSFIHTYYVCLWFYRPQYAIHPEKEGCSADVPIILNASSRPLPPHGLIVNCTPPNITMYGRRHPEVLLLQVYGESSFNLERCLDGVQSKFHPPQCEHTDAILEEWVYGYYSKEIICYHPPTLKEALEDAAEHAEV